MTSSKQKLAQLKLKGDCTIYEVSDLCKKISTLLHEAPVVKLDLSGVEQVDASFIQLLVFAQSEASRVNARLEITGNLDVVSKLATHLCCDVALGSVGNEAA